MKLLNIAVESKGKMTEIEQDQVVRNVDSSLSQKGIEVEEERSIVIPLFLMFLVLFLAPFFTDLFKQL